MKSQLRDIMALLIQLYPESVKQELSNARLTKMVYLVDWHHALTTERQATSIEWYFDNYGPFVWDVYETASSCSDVFSIEFGKNYLGGEKKLIKLKEHHAPLEALPKSVQDSVRHVVVVCSRLYWDDFMQLVYSTDPVLQTERYNKLDLVQASKRRKETGK